MQKLLTQLEVTVFDKIYQFTCAPDSPIEHVKEALFQVQKLVAAIEDQIKAQQESAVQEPVAEKEQPKEEEEKPQE